MKKYLKLIIAITCIFNLSLYTDATSRKKQSKFAQCGWWIKSRFIMEAPRPQIPKPVRISPQDTPDERLREALKCNDSEYWEFGRNEIAQAIKNGADPNTQGQDTVQQMIGMGTTTPLFLATIHNDPELVRLLLTYQANPNLKQGIFPKYPILSAKTLEIALLYKIHRARFDIVDDLGHNLIHNAMFPDSEPELAPFYFKQGVDPDHQDKFRTTPLTDLAIFCKAHSEETMRKKAQFLLSKNVRLNIRTPVGKTPLDIAQSDFNKDCKPCKLLASMIQEEMKRRAQAQD